eukprot:scaffold3143_cov104-Isochrysis_galbana.AAC.6
MRPKHSAMRPASCPPAHRGQACPPHAHAPRRAPPSEHTFGKWACRGKARPPDPLTRGEALVPVREDGESDERVWVRELGRVGGHVLADKRHRQQLARVRRGGGGGLVRQRAVLEKAVVDARHLGDDVRKDRTEPRVRQRAVAPHDAVGARVGVARDVAHDLLIGAVLHTIAPQPQQRPVREERPQPRLVVGPLQKHKVRRALQFKSAGAFGHRLTELAEQLLRLGPLMPRGGALAGGGVEHAVEQVERQLPAQRREVDGLALAVWPEADRPAEDGEHVGERARLGAQLAQLVGAEPRAPWPHAQQPLQAAEQLCVIDRRLGRRCRHLALQNRGALDEFEHHGLERGRVNQEQTAQAGGVAEPLEQERLDGRVPIEAHAVDGAGRQPAQALAEHALSRRQQVGRNHRDDEA